MLDRKNIGGFAARRGEQAIVIGPHELGEVVRADHVSRGARIFEKHGVAGARSQDRLQITLGAFGDVLEERLAEIRVADEVHHQTGHAAQLGGHQERRNDHRRDEEIVTRAFAQSRQRFEHEGHAAAQRGVGVAEAAQIGRLFERAFGNLRVVVVWFLDHAGEGLCLYC